MKKPVILGIGGAHIDRRGQVSGDFIVGASNPGIMGEEVGGGTFNALRNAVQCGAQGWLMSVRGGDAAGETIAQAIALAGIRDLSVTFLDRGTPSYSAILTRDGDVVAALADMGLYEAAFPRQMRRSSLRAAAADSDALFCDANLPASALSQVPGLARGKPVFAIAISPSKAVRLTGILPSLSCLFLNVREAAALTGLAASTPPDTMVAALRGLGVSRAVLTQGSEPIVAFDPSMVSTIVPPAPRRIVDVTGAGDALAGVTAIALLGGLDFAEAVRRGMAASLLALESPAAVAAYDGTRFGEALALVPHALPVHERAQTREDHVA